MSALFDAAVQSLLGDVHGLFGKAATYTPPSGTPVACTIVVDAADDRAQLLSTNFVAGRRIVEVRKAEVPAPAKGGIFALGAASFVVVSSPRSDDPDGLVWTCLCDPQ